jgi:hypothetical protein
MNHNDDISAMFEGELITGFLIGPVSAVLRMDVKNGTGKLRGNDGGTVSAGIVNDDDKVNYALRHYLVVGLLKRFSGVVSRHHHNNFFAREHISIIAAARDLR